MKKILAVTLIIVSLFGLGAAVSRSAEMLAVSFPFVGRWQPSEDPVLLDDYGLQDIQNLRKVGKHFKSIGGHTIINSTSISDYPYILNGFHFRKDQPSETHILIVAADSTTPTASYLYKNTTAVPDAGNFTTMLHTDAAGGFGTGRFSMAPQGNMIYANGPETLIWAGNETPATAVVASAAALTGTGATLTSPQDYSDQLRNSRTTSDQIATFGIVNDAYTKILLHADSTDGVTVITDAISTGRTITAAGSAQIDTEQFKFGIGSILYAYATTDSITTADNSDWNLGSGDFTIDAWVRASSFTSEGTGTVVIGTPQMTSNTTPAAYVATASSEDLPTATQAYRAFDRVAGATYNPWRANNCAGEWLKIDLGFNNEKTVQSYSITAGPANQYISGWTLAGSADESTWTTLDTRTGVTSWSSYEEKTYAVGSPASYRYYKITVNSCVSSPAAIMELKLFIYPYFKATILSNTSTASAGWGFYASGDGLTFSFSSDGSTTVEKTVTWAPSLEQWYHVAVTRATDALKFWVNGTQQGATQDIAGVTINNSTVALSSGDKWSGWIDELRLSKGIARWDATFTVNSAAYGEGTAYWLVGFTRPIKGVKFYIQTPNTVASTITGQEWNGISWTNLSLTDGTAVGGVSLAQTGTVSWPSTVNSSQIKFISGLPIYWYQFTISSGSAAIYYVTVDAPMQSIRNIWDGRMSYAASVLKWDASNYLDNTDAVLDDTALTYLDVSSLATNQYAVIGFTQPVQGIEFTMVSGKENITSSTNMTISYWAGTDWTAVTALSDGTATSTTSLSHTGVASFQSPAPGLEFAQSLQGSIPLYYYKVQFAAGLDATTQIGEIRGIDYPSAIGTYKFSETFQNRLFLFSEYNGERNKAIYSADNAPYIFNGPDSGELYFGDATEIIAAAGLYNVVGSVPVDQLIVGKKNEIYRLSGDSAETWVIKRLSANIGVVAPLSMVSAEFIGGDAPTQVVIWQGDKGFYMTDGGAVVPISEDIKCYFDPNDSRYIPAARRSKTVAWYDPLNQSYKALISAGSGITYHNIELEYSLRHKEWTKIYRTNATGADPLQCGFQVFDTTGISYTYGGNRTGFLYRLEDGSTFNGTNISQYLQTKDLLLDPMRKTAVKYMRTAHKKKTAGGTISIAHYGDQVLTVSGSSNQAVPSAFSAATAPYNTQSCALGPFLYHSFKLSVSDTTVADGMELIGLGLYAEPYTAIR